jgi:hypothetical protein
LAGTERLGGCDAALFDLGDQFSADFLQSTGKAAHVSPDSV